MAALVAPVALAAPEAREDLEDWAELHVQVKSELEETEETAVREVAVGTAEEELADRHMQSSECLQP